MKELINGHFLSILPMSTAEAGRGGCQLLIRYSFMETACGKMLIASTNKGVCYMAFATEGENAVLAELKHLFPEASYEAVTDAMQQKAVAILSMKKMPEEPLPLHLKGTAFQLSVWRELLKIPRGKVISYAELAQILQHPRACRAVGTAVGHNPVSVLIPCHRVVRTDGSLGGYHWGLERKVRLLEQEGFTTNKNMKISLKRGTEGKDL